MDERRLALLCAGLSVALALLVASHERTASVPEGVSPASRDAEIRNRLPARPPPAYHAPKLILVVAGAQGDSQTREAPRAGFARERCAGPPPREPDGRLRAD